MRRIYKPDAVQSRVLSIQVKNEGDEGGGPSMLESFTDSAYRSATILGCMLMVLQQLSGINVLIFYSSNIFERINPGSSGVVGAVIVNISNLIGALCGMLMLGYFGRKTLLVFWSFFMAACMFGMGFSYIEAANCPDPSVNCSAA